MTRIEIPDLALVVMVGASGSGKSTFARKHFRRTGMLSTKASRLVYRAQTGAPSQMAVFSLGAGGDR